MCAIAQLLGRLKKNAWRLHMHLSCRFSILSKRRISLTWRKRCSVTVKMGLFLNRFFPLRIRTMELYKAKLLITSVGQLHQHQSISVYRSSNYWLFLNFFGLYALKTTPTRETIKQLQCIRAVFGNP